MKLPRTRPLRFYIYSPFGQLARLTFDPNGYAGASRTGRLTIALPCGIYRSCTGRWRIARVEVTVQSLRGVGVRLPRLTIRREYF